MIGREKRAGLEVFARLERKRAEVCFSCPAGHCDPDFKAQALQYLQQFRGLQFREFLQRAANIAAIPAPQTHGCLHKLWLAIGAREHTIGIPGAMVDAV